MRTSKYKTRMIVTERKVVSQIMICTILNNNTEQSKAKIGESKFCHHSEFDYLSFPGGSYESLRDEGKSKSDDSPF